MSEPSLTQNSKEMTEKIKNLITNTSRPVKSKENVEKVSKDYIEFIQWFNNGGKKTYEVQPIICKQKINIKIS